MLDSFDFPDPTQVMPVALGEPGDRLFLLQVVHDDVPVLFKVEKSQVAALCDYLGGILADLPPIDEADIPGDPEPPDPRTAITSWPIASLAVAYEEDTDRILVVAEPFDDVVDEADPDSEPPTARIRMTRAQVAGFIRTGRALVAAGRPPCPLCGLPTGPGRHACPRMN
ncbi:DUF3090 family protein [Rhabdothermincola salaria]|uniref:DUF3090 family protein n=1 Tax=Rhabdothermincola salaria TaxID=2903142 RepID=UPI001E4867B4|nr:DUF3090 family protein [Rhabdothermincola salaria]MCD9625093.1 DUF3090 family protein [Rhabdothermincola salaria]